MAGSACLAGSSGLAGPAGLAAGLAWQAGLAGMLALAGKAGQANPRFQKPKVPQIQSSKNTNLGSSNNLKLQTVDVLLQAGQSWDDGNFLNLVCF